MFSKQFENNNKKYAYQVVLITYCISENIGTVSLVFVHRNRNRNRWCQLITGHPVYDQYSVNLEVTN